ncbi:MAG: type II toxin-antitoxin system VapC family toxin [Candidatus Micrarchaeota archaeon]
MIAVDTNALIYRVTEENPELSAEMKKTVRQAKQRFAECYGKHERMAIPMPILTEFANYLRRKFSRQVANNTLDKLISDENFKIIEAKEEYVLRASIMAEELNADFTDSLICTCLFANGIKKILTYDEDFRKFKEMEIIR